MLEQCLLATVRSRFEGRKFRSHHRARGVRGARQHFSVRCLPGAVVCASALSDTFSAADSARARPFALVPAMAPKSKGGRGKRSILAEVVGWKAEGRKADWVGKELDARGYRASRKSQLMSDFRKAPGPLQPSPMKAPSPKYIPQASKYIPRPATIAPDLQLSPSD